MGFLFNIVNFFTSAQAVWYQRQSHRLFYQKSNNNDHSLYQEKNFIIEFLEVFFLSGIAIFLFAVPGTLIATFHVLLIFERSYDRS